MSRLLRSSVVCVSAFFGAAILFAQSGGWLEIESDSPPTLVHVFSESGTQWDQVDMTGVLWFNLKARGRCFEDYRMRQAYICAGRHGDASCVEPTVNQGNRSFSGDDGREWKTFHIERQYMSPKLPVASPVELCNQNLRARLSNQGEAARAGIVRQGFRVTLPDAYQAWFHLNCEEQSVKVFDDWATVEDSADIPVTVVCSGTDPGAPDGHRLKPQAHRMKPEAHRTAAAPGIKDGEIWINPKTDASYTGNCPAKLRVGGELAYYTPEEGPVDVHYRYQVRQGRRRFSSPIFKTRFDDSGRKNLTQWPFLVGPTTSPEIGGLAASGPKDSPALNGEIELVVLGNVPGARSPSTSFSVTCAPGDAPVVDGGSLTARSQPPPPPPAEVRETRRTSSTGTRFGGWRVALPIRDTGRTGLRPGSYVVEVPTQTIAPGDEITVILYPTPGSMPAGVAAPRIPLKNVAKVDSFTVKQNVKPLVLPGGGLQIRVEAPECGCALTGVIDPKPPE